MRRFSCHNLVRHSRPWPKRRSLAFLNHLHGVHRRIHQLGKNVRNMCFGELEWGRGAKPSLQQDVPSRKYTKVASEPRASCQDWDACPCAFLPFAQVSWLQGLPKISIHDLDH